MYLNAAPAATSMTVDEKPCACNENIAVVDEQKRVALSDLSLAISLLSLLFVFARR
jgi:hypothetical protein